MTKLQQKGEFVFVDCMTKLLSHLWEEKEERAKSVQDRSDDVSKLTFSIERCVLTSMSDCVCSLPSPSSPSPFFLSPSSSSSSLLLLLLSSPSSPPPTSPLFHSPETSLCVDCTRCCATRLPVSDRTDLFVLSLMTSACFSVSVWV